MTLKAGAKYTFDLSDPSMDGHPLRFSETPDGTHGGGEQWGTEVNGQPGTAGANIILYAEDWTPETLYYYCEIHSGMGGSGSITTTDEVRVYPTVDDIKNLSWGGETETSITGGVDADLFVVYRPDGDSDQDLILFKVRPEFSNPSDANGDNVYEVELTKTGSNGESVTQAVTITVTEANEGEKRPLDAPGTSLILEIDEVAESLTDDGSNRNIVGTDAADIFSKK